MDITCERERGLDRAHTWLATADMCKLRAGHATEQAQSACHATEQPESQAENIAFCWHSDVSIWFLDITDLQIPSRQAGLLRDQGHI